MSASLIGRPRSRRARRSMTRTVRERIAGLGDGRRGDGGIRAARRVPGAAGRVRSGAEVGRRRSRGRSSPTGSLGIAESTAAAGGGSRVAARDDLSVRTNLHLPDIAFPRGWGMLPDRAKRPGAAAQCGPPSAPPHEQHDDDGLRTDPDRTDHRPRATGHELLSCPAPPWPRSHRRPAVDAVRISVAPPSVSRWW